MENRWRLDTFQSLLGQTLVAKGLEGEGTCQMTVIEVTESHSLGEGWESFSVIFSCDKDIGQGSLNVSHDDHGEATIFINPKSETEHEAVFNYQL